MSINPSRCGAGSASARARTAGEGALDAAQVGRHPQHAGRRGGLMPSCRAMRGSGRRQRRSAPCRRGWRRCPSAPAGERAAPAASASESTNGVSSSRSVVTIGAAGQARACGSGRAMAYSIASGPPAAVGLPTTRSQPAASSTASMSATSSASEQRPVERIRQAQTAAVRPGSRGRSTRAAPTTVADRAPPGAPRCARKLRGRRDRPARHRARGRRCATPRSAPSGRALLHGAQRLRGDARPGLGRAARSVTGSTRCAGSPPSSQPSSVPLQQAVLRQIAERGGHRRAPCANQARERAGVSPSGPGRRRARRSPSARPAPHSASISRSSRRTSWLTTSRTDSRRWRRQARAKTASMIAG